MTEPSRPRPVPGPPRPGPEPAGVPAGVAGVPAGVAGAPAGAADEAPAATGAEQAAAPDRFANLDQRPVVDHVAVFEAEHERLRRELGTIDQL